MAAQVVFMTGCSSGIGLATVRRLVHDPDHQFLIIATVIAMAEKADLVAAVGDALDKTVFIKELDITEDEKITEVVDDVIKTHGRIDILLNIAGLPCLGVVEKIPLETINKVFGVNLIGTIRLTQAVLPSMKRRKSGKIITITSTAGKLGLPYTEIYSSSKFALEGFFESLASSLTPFNIRVCLIEAGSTDTALVTQAGHQLSTTVEDDTIEDSDRQQLTVYLDGFRHKNPKATPEDVAEAIVTRCVNADKPVLRHLLMEDKEPFALSGADLTGEFSVAFGRKLLGIS